MEKARTIDFSALQHGSLLGIRKAPLDFLPGPLKLVVVIAIFLLFPIGCLLFAIVWIIIFEILGFGWGTVVFALGFVPLIILGKRQRAKQKKQVSAVAKFARANKWIVRKAGDNVAAAGHYLAKSSPSEPGGLRVKSIQGTLQGCAFELVIGAGMQNEIDDTAPTNLVMYIKVPDELPRAVLVSRDLTDGLVIFDRMFTEFKDSQKVSLEGGFDEKFQLYVPKGGHIDAMSLVAPDFMQTAEDYVSKYTIVLSGDTLCLLSRDFELSAKAIEEIFNATQSLLKELH